MAFHHIPVMLREVLSALSPQPGQVFADGTLGGGGHSEEILKRLGDSGALYGIDRDQAAIDAASERLRAYPAFHAVHGNFHDVKELLPGVRLNGGLLDLGVSSYQLDTPGRGFSYHDDAPLDMRMDKSQGMTAADYVNSKGAPERTAVLCFAGERELYRAAVVIEIGAEEDYDTQAERVFNALRRVDSDAIDFVFARCPKPDGVGLAVVNRRGKAAAHRVVEV